MADDSTTQTLIVGAAIGLIPLGFKYVIDRLTEAHKAAVSVAAKRRERYYDRQATAIAGMYERLAKFLYAVEKLAIYSIPDKYGISSRNAELTEHLPAAQEAAKETWFYFATNELYFTEKAAGNMRAFLVNADSALRDTERAIRLGLDQLTEEDVKMMADCRQRARDILVILHDRFRELMLVKKPESWIGHWTTSLRWRIKAYKRRRNRKKPEA